MDCHRRWLTLIHKKKVGRPTGDISFALNGHAFGAEHKGTFHSKARRTLKRSVQIAEYIHGLLFEAASAQGPERRWKSSDTGFSSAVGATARSTASLFMLLMGTGHVALQQPLGLGEAGCFPDPCRIICTFNHQHKDWATCQDSDFFQSSPSFLTLLSTKKKCYLPIKLIESQQLS